MAKRIAIIQGHPDAAGNHLLNAMADDAADDFMPRNDWIFDAGKLRIDDMKVRPADAAGAHLDANLPVAGDGVRALLKLERRPRAR